MLIDLHTHSTASDGQYTPTELIKRAKKLDLQLFSITDHDTVGGLAEAEDAAKEYDVPFIPGIEVSCQDEMTDQEIHILGYGIDYKNQELLNSCRMWSEARSNRGEVIKQYLESLGISVDLEVVRSYAGDGNLGRPHFARYLVETGVVEDRKAAFDLYLDTDDFKKATDRKKPGCHEAIELIHEAEGVAVLAHPGLYDYSRNGLEGLVGRLVESGLDGIECFYSKHNQKITDRCLAMVKKYGLKTSCGSDFHGESVKPDVKLGMNLNNQYKDLLITRI